MEEIKSPTVTVKYAGKDITADVSANLISLTYTDAEEGESDEVEMTLDDADGLWRDAWYPSKGDKIDVSIGYGTALVPCGTFTIDRIELAGAPDRITISALAAGIKSKVRTRKSTAHEKQTLKQVAEKIAGENGMTVEGEIANITFERITQNRETDLTFLRRLAEEYGYLFSVRDKKIIFTSIYKIEAGSDVKTIDRTQLDSYSIKDATVQTYKSARVSYRDSKTNKVVTSTVNAGDSLDSGGTIGGGNELTAEDTLEMHDKAETEQQARAKAQAALHRANTGGQEGTFDLYGEPLLVAGSNFQLTGMGKLSGRWHITKSRHSITRSSYVTSVEAKRLKDVTKPEQRKSPKPAPKSPRYPTGTSNRQGGANILTTSFDNGNI